MPNAETETEAVGRKPHVWPTQCVIGNVFSGTYFRERSLLALSGDAVAVECGYSDQRMLIALAITRAARARDTIDSKIIISLAQTRTADTSVGLNARAVLNDKAR